MDVTRLFRTHWCLDKEAAYSVFRLRVLREAIKCAAADFHSQFGDAHCGRWRKVAFASECNKLNWDGEFARSNKEQLCVAVKSTRSDASWSRGVRVQDKQRQFIEGEDLPPIWPRIPVLPFAIRLPFLFLGSSCYPDLKIWFCRSGRGHVMPVELSSK